MVQKSEQLHYLYRVCTDGNHQNERQKESSQDREYFKGASSNSELKHIRVLTLQVN